MVTDEAVQVRGMTTSDESGRCCYVVMRLMSAVRRESIDSVSVGGGSGPLRYRRPVNGRAALMMLARTHTHRHTHHLAQ